MNRRSLLSVVGAVALTGVAGCSGLANRSADATTKQTPTSTRETTTATTTERAFPTPEFTPEAGVIVRNRTDGEQTIEVTVTDPESGAVVFEKKVTLGPDEEWDTSDAFREPDTMMEYVARVRVDDREVTERFQVGKGSGLWRLDVAVEEDEVTAWGTYAN